MKNLQILKNIFPNEEDRFYSGRLNITTEIVRDSKSVYDKISEFKGTGWVCSTHSNEIIRIKPNETFENYNFWPIKAEVVNDESSLHIIRTNNEWKLTTITMEKIENEDDSIIIKSRLRSRTDKNEYLIYETCWTADNTDGYKELRPNSFRFVGFEKGGE